MNQQRAGIIGCGGIAKSHVNGYLANGVKVTAVTDVNPAAAEAFGQEFGAEVFADRDALLASGRVDLVSVCTPPVAHEEAAIAALERKLHVLLEKPQAHTLASAVRIAQAAAASRAVLMLAFRHRFLPAIQTMKQLIADGRIGAPVLFNNIFCGPAFGMKDKWFSRKEIAGGGCLLDTSSHSVDLFRYLFGEVAEQHAVCNRVFEQTDVEDAAFLVLKSTGGVLGSIGSTWTAGSGSAFIDITGQDGRVRYDYFQAGELRIIPRGGQWETISVQASNGFAEEIGHFLSAIAGTEPLACTAQDGLRAMQIISSTYAHGKG